jgi:hypothetical protein
MLAHKRVLVYQIGEDNQTSFPYFVQVMMHIKLTLPHPSHGCCQTSCCGCLSVGIGSVVNHVDDLGSSLLASCMRFALSKSIRLGRGSSLDLLLLMFSFHTR